MQQDRRGSDDGIIAIASNGEAIGAAWLRLWAENDRGCGFIDAQTNRTTACR